jgi:hypothetical protein
MSALLFSLVIFICLDNRAARRKMADALIVGPVAAHEHARKKHEPGQDGSFGGA